MPLLARQDWGQMAAYLTFAADVTDQHSFLHRPGIVAIHKLPDPAIAVVRADRVRFVDGFALSKQRILGGEFQMISVHNEEDEIRLSDKVRAVIIGLFRCANNPFEAATVEPLHTFLGSEKIIFQNAINLAGDVVFLCSRQHKSCRRVRMEESECLHQCSVRDQYDSRIQVRMRQPVRRI